LTVRPQVVERISRVILIFTGAGVLPAPFFFPELRAFCFVEEGTVYTG